MSAKRKFPTLLPLPHSPDDNYSSGEDEDQYYVQPVRTHAKTSIPSELDSDAETESDPDLPTKIVAFAPPRIPSGCGNSYEEEDEENVEKLKLLMKAPEIEPDKKKLKLSGPDQSLTKKSVSALARRWSQDDEMTLLCALSEYHSINGRLPSTKDYASFLSTIIGSVSFPVTEKQLANKIRVLKHSLEQKKRMGPNIKIMKPHAKAVFEICTKLFQHGTKLASKKGVSLLPESNSDKTEVPDGAVGNTSPANSGSDNGASGTKSYIHLESIITNIISEQQCESWLTVEDAIARIGKLGGLQSLETKTKMLRMDTIKLHAREERLKAELFGSLAEGLQMDS